ncbi:MAG: hypothetical protein JSU67_06845 [Gammaproteobacteria bacterium]|nr:MAG: hypothetical protein JSU67_06845 [Gammaproteobacteria bacterium]
MRRFDAISSILLGLILGLASGLQITVANEEGSKLITPETEEAVPGPLDGLAFRGALGPDGKPKDIPDVFVFENGTFVSKECELQCKYPARPYFVRVNGSKTEFISETQCPYKNAKIVWRGTVEGDWIKGKSTWVVKRWYWTVENTFEFEGKLIEKNLSSANTE